MRALHLGLILLFASGPTGCLNAACIQHGGDPTRDLCYDDVARFYLGECDTDDEDLPIRCDDYQLATSCEDEGFDFQCGEIWSRVDLPCG